MQARDREERNAKGIKKKERKKGRLSARDIVKARNIVSKRKREKVTEKEEAGKIEGAERKKQTF